jgi:hypothetical protein
MNMANGAMRAPPAHRSFAAPPKIKKSTISNNKNLYLLAHIGLPEANIFPLG